MALIPVQEKSLIYIEPLLKNRLNQQISDDERTELTYLHDYILRLQGVKKEPVVPIPKEGYPIACPNCGGELGEEVVHSHEDCNGNPFGYKLKTCKKCFHSVTLPGSQWG